MTVNRLSSAGPTGTDRTALDSAIAHGLEHGDWCPKGREAEDGPIPEGCQLNETPPAEFRQRMERNVRDAEVTVVFTVRATFRARFRRTAEVPKRPGRPCLHLCQKAHGDQVVPLPLWILRSRQAQGLNIAGSWASWGPGGKAFVQRRLNTALFPR